jgi:glutamate dehydrogenase
MEIEGQIDQLLDAYARSYIRHADAADITATVVQDRPAFQDLQNALLSGMGRGWRLRSQALAQRYDDLGLDPEVARRIAIRADLQLVPDVADVARVSGQPVLSVYEVFVLLAGTLPVDVLRQHLHQITPHGQWERWQHRGLLDELSELSRAAATHAIAEHPSNDPSQIVSRFLEQRHAPCARVAALVRMVGADPSLHALAVAVRALHDVL